MITWNPLIMLYTTIADLCRKIQRVSLYTRQEMFFFLFSQLFDTVSHQNQSNKWEKIANYVGCGISCHNIQFKWHLILHSIDLLRALTVIWSSSIASDLETLTFFVWVCKLKNKNRTNAMWFGTYKSLEHLFCSR